MNTRSTGPNLHPGVVFPVLERFEEEKKLPTNQSIIGVLRYFTEQNYSHQKAITEVSKRVYAKYFHDTVYFASIRSIERKMKKMWDNFRECRKRFGTGQAGKAIENYKIFVQESRRSF